MSKYDKASLVHIPSGYRSGTLYNVLPNDADGDFDFTRGSTATRVDENGLIETIATGTPRLDYPLLNGVVQDNPTLLLEPQRTNLVTYSEDFSQWITFNSSIVNNDAQSPQGAINAAKLKENTSSSFHDTDINFIFEASTYTFSVFAKAAGRSVIFLQQFDSSTFHSSGNFNLSNGTYSGGSEGKIEDYGNGWYRCSFTATTVVGSGKLYINLHNGVSGNYTGDGTSGVFIFGAQLEEASYPTSYIPSLTGSQTTRSADAANGAEADFNDSEGVLYANISALADDGTERRITISNSSDTSELITIEYDTPSNTIHAFLFDGAFQAEFTHTLVDVTTFAKVCFKYKENDFALWVDGFQIDTDNNGNVFANNTLDLLKFENSTSSNRPFYGTTKEVITFNEALSDTELEALTSYDSFNSMATELLFTIE